MSHNYEETLTRRDYSSCPSACLILCRWGKSDA